MRPARRRGRAVRPPRIRPRLRRGHRRLRPVRRRLARGRARAGLDEPWRPRHAPAARLPRRRHAARARPSPSSPTTRAASTACSSIPEVVHTPHGAPAAAQLHPPRRRAAAATGPWPPSATQAIARIRAQVGQGRVICGLSGGVDFVGRRRADPRGDRRPAHLHLRRHGLLRAGRGRGGRAHLPRPLQHPAGPPRRQRPFLGELDGVTDPETKRKTIGRAVHRGVRGGGGQDRRRRLPRPGHALSRRDRERLVHRRPERHHQVPPQCRRPARAHAHEAGRAAARAVQGRGARARPRARPAGGHRRPPPVPRARASPSASPARSRARSSTSCARPTRSTSRRSAPPASTTRSGRPSRSCCRSAPWA